MGLKKGILLRTAFDTFTIQRQIGAGGSGEVYATVDSEGAEFALKVLDPAKVSALRLRRFRNEIHFCSRSTHPNIVKVHASGVTDSGATFYVMSVYPETLRTLMARRMEHESVLRAFAQILDGVEAAHLQRVWHRDLKPENILSSGRGESIVVADFGIAHFEEEELLTAVATKDGERLANFAYSAPEQKVLGRVVDEKVDVYALGLILNEMFTGVIPLGKGHPRIADVAPNWAYLDPIVDQMLNHEPSGRPSVTSVKRELISRGNEFISLQKLNSLKSEVVRESEVDDPIVRNPISIIAADYQNGQLIFTLSTPPPPNWVMAFQNPRGSWSGIMRAGPEFFTFRGNEARVALPGGTQPKMLRQNAEAYVDMANRQYAVRVKSEHEKKLTHEREQHLGRIKEEEKRQRILADLNG